MEDKKGNLMLGEAQEGDSMVNDWEEKIEGYASFGFRTHNLSLLQPLERARLLM